MTEQSMSILSESWAYTPLGPSAYLGSSLPQILIAGCGGTGARVLGPLMKIIPKDTIVKLFDADTVEERNLARQHFMPEDVGRNKAEVLVERFMLGNSLTSYPVMLTQSTLKSYLTSRTPNIVLGCTDSMDFRHMMSEMLLYCPNVLWIDAGNERHTGQVVMEGSFPGFVVDKMNKQRMVEVSGYVEDTVYYQRTNLEWSELQRPYHYSSLGTPPRLRFTGMSSYYPELMTLDTVTETPRCGERFDLQTVAVNQLAATWMICLLAGVLSGKQSSTVGVKFSTDGLSQPLKMNRPVLKVYQEHWVITQI